MKQSLFNAHLRIKLCPMRQGYLRLWSISMLLPDEFPLCEGSSFFGSIVFTRKYSLLLGVFEAYAHSLYLSMTHEKARSKQALKVSNRGGGVRQEVTGMPIKWPFS